ncbi:hypothetical protein CBR_g13065 [Chara braunii]|uniref:Integrase zinc-binding domain-containing protein n=1 Tax=Chara braunii TaxID=69332 RepID=A0A388KTF7_CHABU|nr:hypothetical protein CBR_g13065 [Chara braunii]|eukprot:GBG73344.1 hypothetical protein CBR_g13065 [Chara braunii]
MAFRTRRKTSAFTLTSGLRECLAASAIPFGMRQWDMNGRLELVLQPFQEEDLWGGKDVQWMMKLALAGNHSLAEEVRTIEEGPNRVRRHEELMGGMYLLVNTLLREPSDLIGSLNPAERGDVVPESQDDEFEEKEIKEASRAEEYDGIYLELGLLLSCKMRDRDASDRAQRMRQRYLVRDGHLFVKRQVRNPRRVICSRNRQIDVVAALHDGIAEGHRGVDPTYAKISELYYWDGMMEMVDFAMQAYRKPLYGDRFLEVSYIYSGWRGRIEILIGASGDIILAEELYLRSVVDEEMARCMAYICKIDPAAPLDISYVVPESIATRVLNDEAPYMESQTTAFTHEGVPLIIID